MSANIALVDEYLKRTTWKASENSNATFSLQGLSQHIATGIVSDYWLNKIYSERVRQFVSENRFHIHDLGFLSAYCSGWSTEDIVLYGFGGVPNKIQCRPPKHFNTALNQIVNFLFTLQGELAGAQALSNLDTYIAPFIRIDGLDHKQVFKYIQSFVYSLNVPTRSGFQAPFTNISMDLVCPKALLEQRIIVGGELHQSLKYSDFQEEMDMFNKAFAEVMVQGDGNGAIFSFPIPTYNLAEGFDWDDERFQPIWEMTAKYGIPYFANFLNSDLDPSDFRSMCCRLRLDTRKLQSRNGGIFGSAPLTGSLGVVTLNMPNLAIRAGSVRRFFDIVKETMEVAKESLEIKRDIVESHMELYPYAKFYLRDIYQRNGTYWNNHFSTIGIVGMNEACSILLGRGIFHNKDFAVSVLQFIKETLTEFQQETGHFYNLEATPAESTCYKLAKKDATLFDNEDIPEFYTNSTMLPVDATDNVFEALTHQESLQTEYTGGTVFHTFLGEKLNDWKKARDLVKSITTRYRIPYVTLTPTFSICNMHGYITGEQHKCPQCDMPTLVYSRIVGYFRPIQDWNQGKRSEFDMRKIYQLTERAPLKFRIGGFNKATYSDYPNKDVASIVFTDGCNLKCGWCHNKQLSHPLINNNNNNNDETKTEDPYDVIDYVASTEHKSLVICGGEPTMQPDLVAFMRLAKENKISVKLDTNGSNPNIIETVLKNGLVDFIAMDVKGSLDRYKNIAGKALRPKLIRKSIQLIKESGIDYEFRTTVIPDLVDIEDIAAVKREIGGLPKLQCFRASESCLDSTYSTHREHTEEEFQQFVDSARAL